MQDNSEDCGRLRIPGLFQDMDVGVVGTRPEQFREGDSEDYENIGSHEFGDPIKNFDMVKVEIHEDSTAREDLNVIINDSV